MIDVLNRPPFYLYYYSLYIQPRSPWKDIVEVLRREMENTHGSSRNKNTWFRFRPYDIEEMVRKEIENRIKEGKIEYTNMKGDIRPIEKMPKINSRNIGRTVLAWLYGSDLKKNEDYYFTAGSSNKVHIKVNKKTLSILGASLI